MATMIGNLCNQAYCKLLLATAITAFSVCVGAQDVTFDFDSALVHAPLPLDIRRYNWSLQFRFALVQLFYPASGHRCLYSAAFLRAVYISSMVFQSELLTSFDTQLTSASVLYASEQFATESSCTMRMTAYRGATYVGTNTYRIPEPWHLAERDITV